MDAKVSAVPADIQDDLDRLGRLLPELAAGHPDLLPELEALAGRLQDQAGYLLRVNQELGRELAEREQAEAENRVLLALIKRAKQEWEATVDSLALFVCLLDEQGVVLRTNRTVEAWGLGKVTQMGGRQLHDLFHPACDLDPCYLAAFLDSAWQGLSADRPTFAEAEDPLLGRWLALQVSPISRETRQDSTAPAGRAVVVIQDITDQMLVRHALQESNLRLEQALVDLQATQEQVVQQERLAAVGQLAAGIAHDFNNTMASIILFADMMLLTSQLSARDRERLATISRQGHHAADLTQQILDFSRKAMLRRSDLALLPFLEGIRVLLSRTLPESIRVELRLPDDELLINVDPTRLQQALMNLAINARDAMPAGGILSISAEPAARDGAPWALIRVRDTGVGIAPEILPHIFEPFFTTKEVGQGTGLGLSQVYGIVTQHGGTLAVTSRPSGTEFSLSFPVVQSVPAPEPEATHTGRGAGECILVVEDDPVVRAAIADGLSMLGYRPLTAANGQEALDAFETRPDQIALVLTDLVMPEMGGMLLCRTLRQRYPLVPVVVLTGYPLSAQDLIAAGGVAWLQKPVDLEHLARVAAVALKRDPPTGAAGGSE